MSTLFIGNLKKNSTESELQNLFRRYGKCRVEVKEQYGFVEFDYHQDAKNAMLHLHNTDLKGLNGSYKARIEFSNKSRSTRGERKEKKWTNREGDKNMCYLCKIQGHQAKNCLINKDACYECGERGHLAKECKQKVREAASLTENRVKAIFSQQGDFKGSTTRESTLKHIALLRKK